MVILMYHKDDNEWLQLWRVLWALEIDGLEDSIEAYFILNETPKTFIIICGDLFKAVLSSMKVEVFSAQ